jgi:hypothetical protein
VNQISIDLIGLKTATDFESLVPRGKGMDFYRASNSPSWGAAVEGAVCRAWDEGCMVRLI